MQMTQTTKLIEGKYSPQEAKEILIDLINNEINFLRLKNLSSEIRFGKPDSASWNRAEELDAARKELLQILQDAKNTQKCIAINSSIQIRIEN